MGVSLKKRMICMNTEGRPCIMPDANGTFACLGNGPCRGEVSCLALFSRPQALNPKPLSPKSGRMSLRFPPGLTVPL